MWKFGPYVHIYVSNGDVVYKATASPFHSYMSILIVVLRYKCYLKCIDCLNFAQCR